MLRRLSDFTVSPERMVRIHFWAAMFWITLAFLVTGPLRSLQQSIAFLVFVSLYANFGTHISSWQATRAELREKRRQS